MNQIEKIIDIATWNRREHYEHFSAFDDPFFGVTVNVDCTRAYQEAKDKGVSFSLLVLHRIVTAAAAVEEFRYRIEGNRVVCYDSLLPEATVGRADHTFSFAAFEYDPDELVYSSGKSRDGTPASHYGTQQRRYVSSQRHSLFGCAVALFHRYEASHQYAFGRQRSQNLHR
jgi:chloramphenicol O-acetyltransferase